MFGTIPATLSVSHSTFAQYAHVVYAYHCGKLSSQRICRLLHVLQPKRDLVWLLRGGPPPGPAILSGYRKNARQCNGLNGNKQGYPLGSQRMCRRRSTTQHCVIRQWVRVEWQQEEVFSGYVSKGKRGKEGKAEERCRYIAVLIAKPRDADSKNNLEPQPRVEEETRNEMKNVRTWGIRENGKGGELGCFVLTNILTGTRGVEKIIRGGGL